VIFVCFDPATLQAYKVALAQEAQRESQNGVLDCR
jgi:hypothetical protein